MLEIKKYNPDILSCLANLSSDEVFTPPRLANEMLDQLPEKIWSDANAKFLDPSTKSGVFLREITKRLIKGLSQKIPNLQKRIDHIFNNQVYGIAITELTSLMTMRSLYCTKNPKGKYSITDIFNNKEGNVRFVNTEHKWAGDRCLYCGASKINYNRDNQLESHAYEFIHKENPNEIFDMKFDVIIGNPPYHLSDGGHSRSASPIYQRFVQKAKQLNPRYLIMIIPARWYIGGKGLDEFRSEMLNDKRLRKIVDYQNSTGVFPGVDIPGGVCYFLWDRDNKGKCELVNIFNNESISSVRKLDEFNVFIRDGKAIPIIKKILQKKENSGKLLSDTVSSRKPFFLPTNYKPQKKGIPCWFIQKIGLRYAKRSDVHDPNSYLMKWKFLIPKAPIAGQTDFSKPVGFYYGGNTRIAKPGECCTESWIVAGAFTSEKEAKSFRSYLFTKIVRFLLLQSVISQDVTRKCFAFVPNLDKYEGKYSDEILTKRWGITKKEWDHIDARITSIDKK